jgi:hypothetical protein
VFIIGNERVVNTDLDQAVSVRLRPQEDPMGCGAKSAGEREATRLFVISAS